MFLNKKMKKNKFPTNRSVLGGGLPRVRHALQFTTRLLIFNSVDHIIRRGCLCLSGQNIKIFNNPLKPAYQ